MSSKQNILEMQAHRLKGSAGGYGFLPGSQVAATLEKAACQPESFHELDAAMQRFKQTCERVEPIGKG